MRILVLDTTIDDDLIGGGHLFLPVLLKGLISQGHDLHLVVKGVPNNKVLPAIKATKAEIHISPWDSCQVVEKQAPVFAQWVNQLAPDIYIISASPDIGWVALPFLNPRIATLTIGHTDDETFYLPARHYSPFITGAVGVSREICETYINSCNIHPSRVKWIPYGVEPAESIREDGEKHQIRIIYAGRIEEEQKRISDIIAISKNLSEREIPYELHFVGDGKDMPRLKRELGNEIARRTVFLHGWQNGERVAELMQQSDIFLLTSDYEGFCIALVEAMANGCCPIVSDIRSGNKDLVVNGENGYIIPIGDVKSFVNRIISLAMNPGELRNIRLAAWKKGQSFTVHRMIEQYAEFFNAATETVEKYPRKQAPDFPLLPTCRSKYPNWIRNLKVISRKAFNRIHKI